MQKIIFDSSFLMAVVEDPTTWYEDIADRVGKFEPILLKVVKEELRRLAEGQGRKARTARVALDLSKSFKPASGGEANTDDEIVSAALSKGAMVATIDSRLVSSLKGVHVGVITLRSGRVSVT